MTSPPIAPPKTVIAARRYRFGASLIDALIFGVISYAITMMAAPGLVDGDDRSAVAQDQGAASGWQDFVFDNPFAGNPYWYIDVSVVILWFLYFWIGHAFWGQTIGKRLCRLKVVSRDGRPLTTSQAGVRSLLYMAVTLLPYVGFLLSLVNVAWIFGPSRRCLHDVVAGTVVVDLNAVAQGSGGSRGGSGRRMLVGGLLVIGLLYLGLLWLAWS
ncbi:RDD family protein [Sphaerisporangium dianthi]|uniref:RDD family protein n=1 Tax=Sphaerisporangium dianthi TaxID=1436120 RepID=A0ABV9CGN8_9ACTN